MSQDKIQHSEKHYLNWVHQLLKLYRIKLSFKNDRSTQIIMSTQSYYSTQAAQAAQDAWAA